jgi:lipoprotein-anchoring transpeptidase ErfK/SrfK
MRAIPSPTRGVLAASIAAVVLVVAGVVVLLSGGGSALEQKISSGGSPPPAASFHVPGVKHGKFPYSKHLRMSVQNGAFSQVKIVQAGLGRMPGRFNTTKTQWRSSVGVPPSSHLKATVSYVNLAHKTTTRHLKIRTAAAKQHFADYLSPTSGTVGIAEPVAVTFDRFVPVKQRAAVEAGLSVTTKPAVVGAWHWMSGEVVHWRPPSYWKSGTKVTVASDLQGVNLGNGVWGPVGRHTSSFKIGAAHVSEADQAAHQLRVYNNGKLIRTFPISTGRAQYPTMDGVHIALAKSPTVIMDSATVGIPKGSPGYYYETVYWDVRISNGGEFVHAAPWSVGSQGVTNVSHGCVNLSTVNATWFYNWSRLGDVVDVYNGVRPPDTGDAGTADWNMSWKQWVAGDAAPTKAAKQAHARPARTYEPGFTPKATSKKHSAKHSKAATHQPAKHKHTSGY